MDWYVKKCSFRREGVGSAFEQQAYDMATVTLECFRFKDMNMLPPSFLGAGEIVTFQSMTLIDPALAFVTSI